MWVVFVWDPTGGTEAVQVLLDVVPAPHAHAVPAGAGHEIAVNHIDLLHTEGARVGFAVTHVVCCFDISVYVCAK